MKIDHLRPEVFVARRARLRERLAGRPALLFSGEPRRRNFPADAIPFRASSHLLYLAGLNAPSAALLVAEEAEGDALFLPAPTADDALWHGTTPSFEELGARIGCALRPRTELPKALARWAGAATIRSFDPESRAAQERALGRSLEAPSEGDRALIEAMIAIRLRHDEGAIAELEGAAEATVAAHRAGMAASAPGRLEAEVRAAMEAEIRRRDLELAYPPIVTTRGEVLHNHAYGHVMERGDLLLADVGAESAGGWAGDVTRTWPVGAPFSGSQRALYEVVLEAQRRAIAMLRPGVRYRDVHLTAASAIAEGLVALGVLKGDPEELTADGVTALFFPHGVGHLLGLDVHDMEDLGDRAGYAPGRARSTQFGLGFLRLDRDLEAGMAVTIEPGFYQVPAILEDPERCAVAKGRLDREALARFADVRGIRIEDDVLITEEGHRVLTEGAPKSVAEVEAAIGL